MLRNALVAIILIVPLAGHQCLAASTKDKAETCKFGADDQKLKGAARDAFMKKCMSDQDDPRGGGASGKPKN